MGYFTSGVFLKQTKSLFLNIVAVFNSSQLNCYKWPSLSYENDHKIIVKLSNAHYLCRDWLNEFSTVNCILWRANNLRELFFFQKPRYLLTYLLYFNYIFLIKLPTIEELTIAIAIASVNLKQQSIGK